jgi:hypothetical protein
MITIPRAKAQDAKEQTESILCGLATWREINQEKRQTIFLKEF